MMYNKKAISELSLEVSYYEIYEEHGHGVMESPYVDGDVVRKVKCSEMDAWIITESMNIEKWGILSERSSWESPMFRYREI